MKQYIDLINRVLENGSERTDRTGTGTISVFGERLEVDLSEGFPLLTTKRIHWKSVVYELLWFLKGRTDVKYLQDRGVTIWDEWQMEDGTIGHGYGYQWRHWRYDVDQIAKLCHGLKWDPYSRRHIVTSWNPYEISRTSLPPCHCFFQCYVNKRDLSLDLQLYQRSGDLFLGVPFNIASYALLVCLLCHCTALQPGRLIINFGDAHIYLNHLKQLDEQLTRDPRPLPSIEIINERDHPWEFEYEDIKLINYHPHPAIKAEVAV